MVEPLKNAYNREYIESLWLAVAKEFPKVKKKEFCDAVFSDGWEELELKDRTSTLREVLHHFFDAPFSEVAPKLEIIGEKFNGYHGVFFPEYVQVYGLDHWDLSMKTLEVLTQYSSAEFAIREFIKKDTDKAMTQMLEWSHHPNEHIRRLASEGCRPRLPWASALNDFKKDPTLIIPILENLLEDESLYVRKSVANNLNDISKDHPKLALKLARKWIRSKHPHTLWIVKHGLRTLLKSSDPSALKLIGIKGSEHVTNFELQSPLFVRMGEELEFSFSFELSKKQKMRFEYAIHFLDKLGKHRRKVFKISEKECDVGEHEQGKAHRFKILTTRRFQYGSHYLEVIINGEVFGHKSFYLAESDFVSPYYVYMILTEKNTIYTGITTDLHRRMREHSGEKKGAKYTKGRAPKEILYLELAADRSQAQKREAALKKLSRPQKEALSTSKYLK